MTTAAKKSLADRYSSSFVSSSAPIAVVMAAGQGRRIKSHRSKMLHRIWGVPTVVRVCRAAAEGLASPDQIVVVGIMADEVIRCLGKKDGRRFVQQKEQRGTGDAVDTAVSDLTPDELQRELFVFPGDKGLLDEETVRSFAEDFRKSPADMMVLVSTFSGDPAENTHGRILRVPERDAAGRSAPKEEQGHVLGIVELKDILALGEDTPLKMQYRGREYAFSRKELIETREFNGGVYAFRGAALKEHLGRLSCDNAQQERYLTDLIALFNQSGLSVAAIPASREEVMLGFNDKAVLQTMEEIFRRIVFDRLKKIVTFHDPDNFFIADEVVDRILDMDAKGISADIYVGEGAHVGAGVVLSPRTRIEKNARLEGNIELGEGVIIGESAYLQTEKGQRMIVDDGTEILPRNTVKGNVRIGKNCRIETTVRLTGSDEWPMRIGDNVRIKGTTYMFGCLLEDNVFVQNCYLFRKRIRFLRDADGQPVKVRHIFPEPEGRECVLEADEASESGLSDES